MIKRIELRNFKRFEKEIFELSDVIVLAGPNNTGKTTLLQAVAVWNLAFNKWLSERGPESGSIARKRTSVVITRKDFTAIPLREMNLLWTNCSTALLKHELQNGQKPGTPRPLEISLEGTNKNDSWRLTFEFRYMNSESLYAKPAESTPYTPQIIQDLQIVHVPPFSGIGAEETRYDRPYQDLLIGQGKPGDILRNLLLEVYKNGKEKWDTLSREIESIFGYQLLPPLYEGRPFILCEYKQGLPEGKGRINKPLDISCAGSGFHQVLTLLGFFYARPASILLLDEPDAHLHVILQKKVYDRLREIAGQQGCQLLIATHSEVLVDSSSPEKIISFLGQKPHRLIENTERDEVREALKRLSSLDILLAEQAPGILYVEGESDINLLREWARILEHPVYDKFLAANPFVYFNQGKHPKEARNHFFALKAVKPTIQGVLLLDGDNRHLADHELSAEGLTITRWKRYEIENYMIHPAALSRFVRSTPADLFSTAASEEGLDYLKNELPPAVFNNPMGEHDYLDATPASKTLIPGFFKSARIHITKKEYYKVAGQMLKKEIPGEVSEKLDLICKTLKL
jgi:predicted ATPase